MIADKWCPFKPPVVGGLLCALVAMGGCNKFNDYDYDYPEGDYTDFQRTVREGAGENALDCGSGTLFDPVIRSCLVDAFAGARAAYGFNVEPQNVRGRATVVRADGSVALYAYLARVPTGMDPGERVQLSESDCLDPSIEYSERSFRPSENFYCSSSPLVER